MKYVSQLSKSSKEIKGKIYMALPGLPVVQAADHIRSGASSPAGRRTLVPLCWSVDLSPRLESI